MWPRRVVPSKHLVFLQTMRPSNHTGRTLAGGDHLAGRSPLAGVPPASRPVSTHPRHRPPRNRSAGPRRSRRAHLAVHPPCNSGERWLARPFADGSHYEGDQQRARRQVDLCAGRDRGHHRDRSASPCRRVRRVACAGTAGRPTFSHAYRSRWATEAPVRDAEWLRRHYDARYGRHG
jgi:hypothetical protein